MKFAQDFLSEAATGEHRGGFNARLYGESMLCCMDGIPNGSRWGQRNFGWTLADRMIKDGEIFSMIRIGGKEFEFKCYLEGDMWCCVGPRFENIQESDCAFADTREEAIKEFSLLID